MTNLTRRMKTGLTATALLIGLGAAGTGVAVAATPTPAPPPASDNAHPTDPAAGLQQMDQMMATMVATLPADQREAANRMHQQMRPAMAKMMSEGGMAQMGSDMHGKTGN